MIARAVTFQLVLAGIRSDPRGARRPHRAEAVGGGGQEPSGRRCRQASRNACAIATLARYRSLKPRLRAGVSLLGDANSRRRFQRGARGRIFAHAVREATLPLGELAAHHRRRGGEARKTARGAAAAERSPTAAPSDRAAHTTGYWLPACRKEMDVGHE